MRIKLCALALMACVFAPWAADAVPYEIDASHSSVEFSIRHLVARTSGRFTDFAGTIHFDPEKLDEGNVEVTIQAASIDTANEERDTHLKNADFFDVEEHPEIRFVGETATKTDDGFDVTGTLTLLGVEQEVTLPVEFLGAGADPWGNDRAGFYTELKLNRKDFGMNWNKGLDHGGFILGDDVKVRISIEAMYAKPEEKADGGW